jgi:hypothetical protein
VATVRRDVLRQKVRDQDFDGPQGVLLPRMVAVLGAQKAVAAGETGARYALRQALVDLSAAAELAADELPAPAIERVRVGPRSGWNV